MSITDISVITLLVIFGFMTLIATMYLVVYIYRYFEFRSAFGVSPKDPDAEWRVKKKLLILEAIRSHLTNNELGTPFTEELSDFNYLCNRFEHLYQLARSHGINV